MTVLDTLYNSKHLFLINFSIANELKTPEQNTDFFLCLYIFQVDWEWHA